MEAFRKIEAWKKAHQLVLNLYRESQQLPKEEIFGVTMQLRRGAASIATKIAAGAGRNNLGEKTADWHKAAAATNELEYTVVLATDLGYFETELSNTLIASVAEVRKMLYGLLRTL